MTAVYVDHVHGFGMFYYEVNTTSDSNCFSEKTFDLLIYTKIFKNRGLALVKFNDVHFCGAMVPIKLLISSQSAVSFTCTLLNDSLSRSRNMADVRSSSLTIFTGAFALSNLLLILSHFSTRLFRSASSSATFLFSATVRIITPKLFGLMLWISLLIGCALRCCEFLRNRNATRKWHQHKVSARERNFGRNPGAFCRNGLLGNLH